jgi:hypothetical protein
MIERTVTLPELGMIAGTRMVLGAGLGLLLSDRLDKKPKRAAGWTLLMVGALTTLPLVAGVLHERPARDGIARRSVKKLSQLKRRLL